MFNSQMCLVATELIAQIWHISNITKKSVGQGSKKLLPQGSCIVDLNFHLQKYTKV